MGNHVTWPNRDLGVFNDPFPQYNNSVNNISSKVTK